MTPLSGGENGETFLAVTGGSRSVVRVYGEASAWRGPDAPLIDAAVLRLLRGLAPVPEVLEVRSAVGEAPGLLVATELPGVRADTLIDGAAGAPAQAAALGATARLHAAEQLGAMAARIAGAPMVRRGVFADAHLRIEDFPEAAAPGEVVAAMEAAYARGALAGWPADRLRGLGRMAARAERLLEDGEEHLGGAACLSHGDLKARNLLLDPAAGSLTGVVDVEFAHAGVPWTDLGTLLRHGEGPVASEFAEALLQSWRAVIRLVDPPGASALLDLARAADLLALARLAGPDSASGRSATRALAAVADSRDLHAPPR